MAWSYGNKRWELSFQSMNGTTCRVDIYKRGYSGSSYTTLTGGQDPFFWEEDNDESLLKVVRQKTGYINVIETSNGSLSDLAPATDSDHFVEFYYGSTLYFTGFMQAQNFENDWAPAPRRMSFPVQSPLALIYGKKFNIPQAPSYLRLAEVLKEVCDGLQANIGYVIFPSGYRSDMNLSLYINTMVYCPYNDEWQCSAQSTEPLFTATTYGEFIEGLCNCFGLMVHDLPGYMVFSRFDYKQIYEKWDVRYMGGSAYHPSTYEYGDEVLDLTGISIKGNDNTESMVLPVHEVELEYEGDFYKQEEIDITKGKVSDTYHGTTYDDDQVVFYEAINISVPLLRTSSHSLPSAVRGVWLLAAGNGLQKMVLVDERGGGYSSAQEILTWKIYIPPKTSSYFTIAFDLLRGANIKEASKSDVAVGIKVKNGSMYYNASTYQWSSSSMINSVDGNDGLHELVVAGEPYKTEPLEVTLYMGSMGSFPDSLYLIENLTLKYNQGQLGEYATKAPQNNRKITSDNGSPDTISVSQLFNVATFNFNALLAGGSSWFDDNVVCDYAYMFQSQNRLQAEFNIVSIAPSDYTRLIKFYISSWRWRMISLNCEPWNDKMKMTIHRSPTLE